MIIIDSTGRGGDECHQVGPQDGRQDGGAMPRAGGRTGRRAKTIRGCAQESAQGGARHQGVHF